MNRRTILRAFGLGAVGVGLAACGTDTTSGSGGSPADSGSATAEIPDETAGPYPGDGSNGPDVLEQSGIVRSDLRSSFGGASGTAEGVPMTLELDLKDLAHGGSAFAGVAVYVWHCDRAGRYSMYSDGVADQNYLRGVQVADDGGVVRFTSVFPACYAGRWPHIHVEVYPDAESGYEASVRNLAGISLSSDNVFGDDSGALQIATVTGDVEQGYTVKLTVGVDTATTPAAGGVASGTDGNPPARPDGPPPSTTG